jgi:hypothetical protein
MTSIFETLSVGVTNPPTNRNGAVHVARLQTALPAPKTLDVHGSLNPTPQRHPLVRQLMQLSLYLQWLSLAKAALRGRCEFAALGPCCTGTSLPEMPQRHRGLGLVLMVAVHY